MHLYTLSNVFIREKKSLYILYILFEADLCIHDIFVSLWVFAYLFKVYNVFGVLMSHIKQYAAYLLIIKPHGLVADSRLGETIGRPFPAVKGLNQKIKKKIIDLNHNFIY